MAGSGQAAERPLVVVATERGTSRLVAVDARARSLNLAPGQTLADARAMRPGLDVAEANPAADQAMLEAIAAACERYTPLVALDRTDGVMLDITGCAHLFGGEAALAKDALRRLGGAGVAARAAIAPNPAAASALARFAKGPLVIRADPLGLNIEPGFLPVEALDQEPAVTAALKRVGLKRVCDLLALPRAPLAARFGSGLVSVLDRLTGRAKEPISPRRPVPVHVAERALMDPITSEEEVLTIVLSLAAVIRPGLERAGQGARKLELALFRVDGAVHHLAVGTGRPLTDPIAIHDLFRHRLDRLSGALDAGFGFDLVRLSVTEAEVAPAAQIALDRRTHDEDLARLVDRLGARLGPGRVRRALPCASHLPERSARLAPAGGTGTEAAAAWARAPTPPAGEQLIERPLRLFARPEQIHVTALVPDGPPVRFRWRRVMHEVRRAEGPERIAPEWWRAGEGALTRDYFRIEDTTGTRFWVYRDGLYSRETAQPRWFMHGLFA